MVESKAEVERPSGLMVESGQSVPLLGVKVEAEIKDFCTRVTLIQRYRNLEQNPIEAIYIFPLEEGAAICGFDAEIDGVRITGQVKEKEAAFVEYDDAITAGHGAYLLDQECPDIFTASIGNLPPGKEVAIRISYVSELGLEGSDVRFVVPTTVSPRYAPLEDQQGLGKTPAESMNPLLAWEVPYGMDIQVHFDMGSEIRSIESPSHPVSVEINGPTALVGLGSRETAMDRDFVLLARLAEPHQPICRLEKTASGEVAAMLAFQPEFGETTGEEPCEVVFVVDRSGSMGGTSIQEARNALQLCLRSLPEGSYFNIVGFGSSHHQLFPESRPYGAASLKEASEHVQNLQADLGGTEILPALKAVFESASRSEMPRQLLVLTDGEVTNTEAVVSLVRKHSDRVRVFTFGIGAGASHHLVRGMARAGDGSAEFIYPGERLEAKVMRQLSRVLVPAFSEVKVDWAGLKVDQAPYRIPPVFSGGRVLVYGFLQDPAVAEVSLKGVSRQGEMAFDLRLDPAAAQEGDLLATLAARTKVRDLEEGASALHDRRGSLQERGTENAVKNEIVRLGVRYGLSSRETSFIAVEERETPVDGKLELRKIPVALTSGWGGLEERLRAAGRQALGGPDGAVAVQMVAPMASFDQLDEGDLMDSDAPFSNVSYEAAAPALPRARDFRSMFKRRPASKPAPARALAPSGLDALVRLQGADGAWDLTDELARLIGLDIAKIEQAVAACQGPVELARRALATALALDWLERSAAATRSEWQLLARKAKRWLLACQVRPARATDWSVMAETLRQGARSLSE